MIIAKPTGIRLEEHIKNVVEEAEKILQSHPFVIEKYKTITDKSLEKRLISAAKHHDDGKKHRKWQNACQKDHFNFSKTGKTNGENLRKSGIRHEMESLYLHKNHNFSDVLKVSIAAHHAKLGNKFELRWEKDEGGKYAFLWEEFKKLSYSIPMADLGEIEKYKEAIIRNYEYSAPRAYLQLADHRASIIEDNYVVPEFSNFNYYFNKNWTKRPVQKIAEDNWKDDLLLLRAPTGAGKTDACLLWAKKQIENNRADRLIIAMPTRFTSNALSINITNSLSETGLYHSSAWFVNYFEEVKNDPQKEHIFKLQHEFARILETPVTVSTIDHLLMSLTHSREDHHTITFNLANSCVVIDEADFYDEFTQANILELLKVLKILDVPVLLMSASLPESSLKLYKKTGYEVNNIKEDKSDYKRIRCKINEIKKYGNTNDLQNLVNKAKNEPTIIYANTVAKAMDIFKAFPEELRHDITLYHSRFTEPDKAKKESELINKLGKDAWNKNNAKGIAIMTQIGEMSVNISSDYMISEICPIDRLVQRLGRLSRFNKKIGNLDLLIPIKDEKVYPAPYGSFDRKTGWSMNKALEATIRIIKNEDYNAEKLVDLINEVYNNIDGFSNKTIDNVRKLRDQIIQNWLILPKAIVNEDDDNTHIWKTRDINNQAEVFVLNPFSYIEDNEQKYSTLKKNRNKECFFDNYKEFMFYKNQYSVSCPSYLLHKKDSELKEANVYLSEKIWIGDSKEPLRIWLTNLYDDKFGLHLTHNFEMVHS